MGTTAISEGDEYVINGHKWFTTAADGATFAIVMANTNNDASLYERASMIIVPTDTKGFHLVRNISIMGETGEGYHSHGEIEYINCRVPAIQFNWKRRHRFFTGTGTAWARAVFIIACAGLEFVKGHFS